LDEFLDAFSPKERKEWDEQHENQHSGFDEAIAEAAAKAQAQRGGATIHPFPKGKQGKGKRGTGTASGAPPGAKERKQSDVLLDLAKAASLFHTNDAVGYADIVVDGHRETWPVDSTGFRRWLIRQFFAVVESAPSANAMKEAIGVLDAKAQVAQERAIYVRVGGFDGRLYLDLCDKTWRAVEITSLGWRIVDEPTVRFKRAKGMLPLPVPVEGGSIMTLRQFLNLEPSPTKRRPISTGATRHLTLISCWQSPGFWPPSATGGRTRF
jgi:hypothetical protein